jgi:hypothetical protein
MGLSLAWAFRRRVALQRSHYRISSACLGLQKFDVVGFRCLIALPPVLA